MTSEMNENAPAAAVAEAAPAAAAVGATTSCWTLQSSHAHLTQLILSVAALCGVPVVASDAAPTVASPFKRPSVTLTTPHGALHDVHAILSFLSRDKLLGSSAFEAALVHEWLSFAAHEIDLPAAAWLLPITGAVKENPAATAQAKKDVRRVLQLLNDRLAPPRATLLGAAAPGDDSPLAWTLADIVVAFSLLPLYQLVLDGSFRAKFEHTNAFFARVMALPEVRDHVGPVALCEKMQTAAK